MRRPVLLLVLAVSAALVVPAAADPPGSDSSYPFHGSDTSTCTSGAECTVTSSSDISGPTSVSSSYGRDVAGDGNENSWGYGGQRFTVKLPPGTTRVTATFVWQVSSAAVAATSRTGRLFAYAGVAAFVPGCQDACTTSPDSTTVLTTASSNGAPATTSGSGAAQVVTLHVTAAGKLGRFVSWLTYAYAGAGGTQSQLCPGAGLDCQTLSSVHSGTASATVAATLTSSSVTFG